jgi:hypothetical protein
MSTIKEIEKAIANLKPDEMARFRAWFEEFDAATWDSQMEEDARSGKLDRVAEKEINQFKKGNFKSL